MIRVQTTNQKRVYDHHHEREFQKFQGQTSFANL